MGTEFVVRCAGWTSSPSSWGRSRLPINHLQLPSLPLGTNPTVLLLQAAPGQGCHRAAVISGPPDQEASPVDFTPSLQGNSAPLSQDLRGVRCTTGPWHPSSGDNALVQAVDHTVPRPESVRLHLPVTLSARVRPHSPPPALRAPEPSSSLPAHPGSYFPDGHPSPRLPCTQMSSRMFLAHLRHKVHQVPS